MAKTLVTLLATIAFIGFAFDASAQSRKCPKGSVWNPDLGKCVIPRGSN